MTFEDFIKDWVPRYLGVHPDFGITVALVLKEELTGKYYRKESYKNARERAKMLVPYFTWRFFKKKRVLDCIELAILLHYEKERGENHNAKERISKTYLVRTGKIEAGVLDWWNP
jgi:hypothetical protein